MPLQKRLKTVGLAARSHNTLLPLYKKVVFVDWYGVLSHDVFWSNIVTNPRHRLFSKVQHARNTIFSKRTGLVSDWMRGKLTTSQVISTISAEASQMELLESLMNGCKKMAFDRGLLIELQRIRNACFLVLATDNMDCFVDNIDENYFISQAFDSMLCSSNLGVLKSEDPKQFFSAWLDKHRLSFNDAILLDDSDLHCRRFEKAGGLAIRVTTSEKLINDLKNKMPYVGHSF